MKRLPILRIYLVIPGILFPYLLLGQTLHLTKSLNFHKHIMDIVFSTQEPYSPLLYIYKLHPKEKEDAEMVMVSDATEASASEPLSKTGKPKPEVEYALKIAGVKDSFALEAGDFSMSLTSRHIIAVGEGDSLYKLYTVRENGIKCTDSIAIAKPTEESNTFNFTSPSGEFYLTWKINNGEGLLLTIYDSSLLKIGTINEPKHEYYADFANNDTVVIVNWTKQTSSFNLQKYFLCKGKPPVKLGETSVDLSGVTDSWGIRPYYVNDTLTVVSVQMYNKRETYIYAINSTGKIYWTEDVPDYISDLTILKGARKIAISFYNLQQVSTIKFYSLLTGKQEKSISLMAAFPDFTTRTKWPVYMPLRQAVLPGGKLVVCLISAYSPDDENISNFYLLVSDGTTIMKTKLKKSKSITMTSIVPLAENKFAVTIDDAIYYYSIF